MNKTLKTVIIIVVVLAVIGACIGGYFVWRHNNLYIGKDAALDIALKDAELTPALVYDVDIDFEKNRGQAWYNIEFKTHSAEYDYTIGASDGAILNSYSEPD